MMFCRFELFKFSSLYCNVTFLISDHFANISKEFDLTKKKTLQIRDLVTLIHGISKINNQKFLVKYANYIFPGCDLWG